MPVNTPSADYRAHVGAWMRCRDAADGSDAVKAKGATYLPRLGSHVKYPARYDEYKLRALFYNATGRTVEGFAGAIFQKAPNFKLPDRLAAHVKDITLAGVSAELFALGATREVLKTGRYGVLVEMPSAASAEQRPYWVGYRAEDIVAWRTTRLNGDEILTRVVLREIVEEPDQKDDFVTKAVEQYRVLSLAGRVYTQTVYRKKDDLGDDWAPFVTEEGQKDPFTTPLRRGVPLDFIPFVFIGPTSVSPAVEKPPLVDLVDVNLSHYRGSADLKHGLHFAALPTAVISGAISGDDGGPLEIGSGTAWQLEKGGAAAMLEVAGPGFAAIRTDLQDMQRMMATLGARLLEEQPSAAETMGAVGMRHAGEHATLRTIAQTIEAALTLVLRWHCWWMGAEAKPGEVEAFVELSKDYFAVKASPDEVRAALLAVQAERISFTTFYARLQAGGWAREGVTAEEELAAIAREGSLAQPPVIEPPVSGEGGEVA